MCPEESEAAPSDASESVAPEPTVESLQAELLDVKDRLLRAMADYDNLQKRQAREALVERERVKARFLEGFLQVFEYSQMATLEAEKSPGPLAEGVKMVSREFERLLEQEGVQTIGKVGDMFDKDLHEAIGDEKSDESVGTILRVAKPGYTLGERVLRYAQVVVSK